MLIREQKRVEPEVVNTYWLGYRKAAQHFLKIVAGVFLFKHTGSLFGLWSTNNSEQENESAKTIVEKNENNVLMHTSSIFASSVSATTTSATFLDNTATPFLTEKQRPNMQFKKLKLSSITENEAQNESLEEIELPDNTKRLLSLPRKSITSRKKPSFNLFQLGTVNRVNSYTTDQQIHPAVAAFKNTGTGPLERASLIAWMSMNQVSSTSESDIYLNYYDSFGVSADLGLVNTNTVGWQGDPAVATLYGSFPGFVVVWLGPSQDGTGYNIYGQRYTNGLSKTGSEFLVNTFMPGDQMYPKVTALTNGGFVVTWWSMNQDQADQKYGIYAQVFNSSGVKVGSEVLVNTFTIGNQMFCDITELTDGGFVVTWQSENQDPNESGYYGIYGQVFEGSGAKRGAPFRANTYYINNQERAKVAGLSTGGFVIAWSSYGQTQDYDIYAQRFTATGNIVGSEILVNSYTPGRQFFCTLTGDNNGGFTIAYTGDLLGKDIMINRFDSSGNALDNGDLVVNIDSSLGDQDNPSLSSLGSYTFHIAWDDNADVYKKYFTVPVITSNAATITYNSNTSPIAIDTSLVLTGSTPQKVFISFTNNFNSAEDRLYFTDQNGISGSFNNNQGILTLSGSATLANYQTAIRSVTYGNLSESPQTVTRSLAIKVNDGTFNSNSITYSLNVNAINNAPEIENNALTISEGQTITLTGAMLSAKDSGDIDANLTFIISNVQHGHFELATNTGVAITNFIQQQISNGEVLFVHDGSETAPSYDVSVSDGKITIAASPATVTFNNINDAPVLSSTASGSVSYIENDPAVVIDNTISINDIDSSNLSSATVTISSGFNAAEDKLNFTAQNGISGLYDSSLGILTLSGTATLSNYQEALRSITYQNILVNPTTTSRGITFIVNDSGLNSNSINRSVNVVAVTPSLSSSASATGTGLSASGSGLPSSSSTATTTSTGGTTNSMSGSGTVTDNSNSGTTIASVTGTDLPTSLSSSASSTATADGTTNSVSGTVTDNSNSATATISATGTDLPASLSSSSSSTATTDGTTNSVSGTVTDNSNSATATISATGTDLPASISSSSSNTATTDGTTNSVSGTVTDNSNSATATISATGTDLPASLSSSSSNTATTDGTTNSVSGTVTDNSNSGTTTASATGSHLPATLSSSSSNTATTDGTTNSVSSSGTLTDNSNSATAIISATGTDLPASLSSTSSNTATTDGASNSMSSSSSSTGSNTNSGSSSSTGTLINSITGTPFVNNPPQLISDLIKREYRNDFSFIEVIPQVEIRDYDNKFIQNATVAIKGRLHTSDRLDCDLLNGSGINKYQDIVKGQLILRGNGSIEDYQWILRTVKYTTTIFANANLDPIRPINISMMVSDGAEDSNQAITLVDVMNCDYSQGPKFKFGVNSYPSVNNGEDLLISTEVLDVIKNERNIGAEYLRFRVENISHGLFQFQDRKTMEVSNTTTFKYADIKSNQFRFVRFVHDGSGKSATFQIRLDDGVYQTCPSQVEIGVSENYGGSTTRSIFSGNTGIGVITAITAAGVAAGYGVFRFFRRHNQTNRQKNQSQRIFYLPQDNETELTRSQNFNVNANNGVEGENALVNRLT